MEEKYDCLKQLYTNTIVSGHWKWVPVPWNKKWLQLWPHAKMWEGPAAKAEKP